MPHLVQLQAVLGRTWDAGDICTLAGVLYYCVAPTTAEPPTADWLEMSGEGPPGPQGDPGIEGEQGIQGIQGIPGIPGASVWGGITGVLSTQSDLQTALDGKVLTTDPRLSDARTPTAHKTSHQNNGADEISVAGLSGLLADGQTPLAHAASHKSGGSDAVKLDELAAPTDVTTLNATTSLHGLLRKLDGLTSTFLRGDGAWAAPTAAASISQTEIDFGATPVAEASFTVTDANVSAGSKIIGCVAYVAPAGKDLDELDMDGLDLKFGPGSGQFTIYARGMDGYVADKFKINYQVGA